MYAATTTVTAANGASPRYRDLASVHSLLERGRFCSHQVAQSQTTAGERAVRDQRRPQGRRRRACVDGAIHTWPCNLPLRAGFTCKRRMIMLVFWASPPSLTYAIHHCLMPCVPEARLWITSLEHKALKPINAGCDFKDCVPRSRAPGEHAVQMLPGHIITVTTFKAPHPAAERPANMLSSCAHPISVAQPLPASHTASRVSSARGTMSPLPASDSSTVATDRPASDPGSAKFCTCSMSEQHVSKCTARRRVCLLQCT